MKLRAPRSILIGSGVLGGIAVLPIVARAQNSTASTSSNADYEPLGIDGSGTTNPSKCFWHIMSKFNEQIKLPTQFSYRAVGSGTGIKEFLGKGIEIDGVESDTYLPYNDFGSGDIPISAEDRSDASSRGIEFVQLPFALSAVSFFHSVPGVPSGEMGLNMTACLLARIFNANITTWDDPEILDVNPGLVVERDYPIYVARRILGSSSTYSVTNYLRAQCPDGWSEDMTGSEIEWHPSTNGCDGSDLMTNCINENEGAIGYLDAAHGHEELLTEISLRNGDGRFLTSVSAGVEGVQAAVDLALVPTSADEDFSKPGSNTWPITLVSYVYIRKDLSFIKNPARRTLLKAFATALFDPDYIGLCDRYGIVPAPLALKQLSIVGLEMLELDASASDDWSFEKDTMPGVGQGDYVISSRRQNFGLYEADRLADDLAPLIEEVRQLKLELASLKASAYSASGIAVGGSAAASLVIGLVVLAGMAVVN
ncbi:hypothetical protein ACHAXA_006893 [Cyclostephanos tholiformis]|uniref:PBP domain-containing protein n=1 Tax=Cyclostephanos tholiformis TaxID=382380 RepID=A0ABD3SDC2_9STRA